jgi:hypothetical protein
VYQGFDRNFQREIHLGDLFGIVIFEGEPEIYRLDDRQASRELVRYYEDEGYKGARVLISEFDGFHSNPSLTDKDTHPVFAGRGM